MNRIFSLRLCDGFQELRTISVDRYRCRLKRLVWCRCISWFAGCLSSSSWFGLFISHMYMDLVMIMVLVLAVTLKLVLVCHAIPFMDDYFIELTIHLLCFYI